jgi:hypothetical protein
MSKRKNNMHKLNIFKAVMVLIVFGVFSYLNCTKESKETEGDINGVVKELTENSEAIIYPAYIIYEDTLLATTNESGEYLISSLKEDTYTLICSALNFRDTIEQVKVVGGETVTHNFSLQPDNTTGLLLGEFQDMLIFSDSLETNPGLAEWDEKQIFNAATGATIQMKWLQYPVGNREVYLGDSLLGISDFFGQYAFNIQCGTYCFEGKCEGYISKTHIVKILPDAKFYLNFFLERE